MRLPINSNDFSFIFVDNLRDLTYDFKKNLLGPIWSKKLSISLSHFIDSKGNQTATKQCTDECTT